MWGEQLKLQRPYCFLEQTKQKGVVRNERLPVGKQLERVLGLLGELP